MSEFAAEFEVLHACAYRVGFRLIGSRADADDVAAETMARAYLAWPRIKPYARPWVARVSGNLAIDVIRRHDREGGATVEARTADPLLEQRLDLYRALSLLGRRQREVVVLRYIADLPEREVASHLHCSVGTVKTHATRGLAALRLTLAEEAV